MNKSCSNYFGSLEIKCIADAKVVKIVKKQDLETAEMW